ncbi:efflux transporter periplasmic adaptor subunit, partial [Bosea thiooxidans]
MSGTVASGLLRRTALIVSLAALPTMVSAQQQPVPSVAVETVRLSDFELKARLPGRIKASTMAEVRPQVSGIIRERLFEEGARVTVGQPLYKIEDET